MRRICISDELFNEDGSLKYLRPDDWRDDFITAEMQPEGNDNPIWGMLSDRSHPAIRRSGEAFRSTSEKPRSGNKRLAPVSRDRPRGFPGAA